MMQPLHRQMKGREVVGRKVVSRNVVSLMLDLTAMRLPPANSKPGIKIKTTFTTSRKTWIKTSGQTRQVQLMMRLQHIRMTN